MSPKVRNKRERVLVAMSGGVDSSVAAGLLLKEGYGVAGAFMVNYDTNDANSDANAANYANVTNTNCWVSDYRDAVRVAAKLGIKLLKLNFTKEYNDLVLDYMFREYQAGRTPNPDVLCNKFVKFGVWLEKAREMGYEKLATGHYARLKKQETRNKKQTNIQLPITNYQLLAAKDENKDQTYFLHQLNQKQLSKVLFPLGDYTKPQVRALARKWGLPTAEKEESMGICFVGEVPMREFLESRIASKPGSIIFSQTGEAVGEHQGLSFYTIGQRHIGRYKIQDTNKLKIQNSKKIRNQKSEIDTKPFYVVEKRMEDNTLVVGYEDDPLLYKKEAIVKDINWISGREPAFLLKCKVRLRHRQPMQDAQVTRYKLHVIVKFKNPQRAVTPGQFAVFYLPRGEAFRGKNDVCLGGGVIDL